MKHTTVRIFALALLAGIAASTAFAGGPLYTFDPENRIAYAWNPASWPGGAVPVYTDLGALGRLSNERADELTADAFAQWNSVSTSTFEGAVVGDLSILGFGDIDSTNVASIIGTFNGGGIHVIYDNDGNILRNFFGVLPTSVLGISNVEYVVDGGAEIVESWTVLSGPGVRSTDPNGIGFAGVFTHEFGHALNLGHTTTNGQTGSPNNDVPQPRDCAAPWTGKPTVAQYETMYPLINPVPGGSGEYMFTVDRTDDTSALSNLNPAPGWPESHGTIRGTIYARHRAQGGTQNNQYEVTGVNVIARRVDDPFGDASSYLSGQVSKGFAGPDGSFEINGLTPGASYLLYVDNLLSGAYSVPRLLVLPGPEEYYNGASESGDGLTDDRCAWTPIAVQAGQAATADVVFNRVKGAPEFIGAPGLGIPTDITPDGGIIVGVIGNSAVFRWDVAAGTYENIGGVPSGQAAISDDGTRIAANYRAEDGISYFAIHENGSWATLPPRDGATAPCGSSWGSVYDISGDGSTVVGLSYGNGCATAGVRGFKWTAADGSVALPKVDNADRAGRANTVNYDGSVIGGWDDASSGQSGGRRGVYWVDGTPSFVLSNAGLNTGEVLDVTGNGTYLVGASSVAGTARNAWRYSETGGLDILGSMPLTSSSSAGATSADGQVLGGWSDSQFARIPTIWTAEIGWTNLNQFLSAQGTYPGDLIIFNATAMSADGTKITGWANSIFGQVGWLIDSPKVVMCHVPPDNPTGKSRTIDVTFPDGIATHLAHGDTVGICQHGGM